MKNSGKKKITQWSCTALGLVLCSTAMAADLEVEFTDPKWTGKLVPEDQVCQRFEGKGSTPPMHVSGIPAGAEMIVVEFNDESYDPMDRGGHGIVGFAVSAGAAEADLPAVPGESDDLPAGVTTVKAHRGSGWSGTGGAYLPPCSGWNGNKYTAKLKAMGGGKILAEGFIKLGKF